MMTESDNDRAPIAGRRPRSLATPHGPVELPVFLPDATRASVRGVACSELRAVGIRAVVVNTYHLDLLPGGGLLASAGGVHGFMGWDGPILSDSGGYQVYSLIHRNPEMGVITEDGAEFRSVIDGTKRLLTPERAIAVQFDLGTDIMVCLDDPRPNDVSDDVMEVSVDRTIRWAARCRAEYDRQVASRNLSDGKQPLLFAVVQGGKNVALRVRCAAELIGIGFDGYGFGGRHVDTEGTFLEEIVRETAAAIPEDVPRFALGIGTPEDIVRCRALGWDMFDCVIPTREGRHGRLFVRNDADGGMCETINITNERYKEDFAPVDDRCDCELCRNYTKAYLRHLFRVADPLGGRLASVHNLRFYSSLLQTLRSAL